MRQSIKVLSVILPLVFLATSVYSSSSLVYKISVPDRIGKVKERFVGDSEGVVVHIQDAHKSSEAQKNIANIIEFLARKDGVSIVGVEGAIGEYDLKQYRDLPFPNEKRDAIFKMVKDGFFMGAEYAYIISSKDLELVGIEDDDVLNENIKAFIDTTSVREEAEWEFSLIDEAVDALEPQVYNENLLDFAALVKEYEERNVDFIDFSLGTIKKAKELKIDLSDFLDISQYVEYLEAKESLDITLVNEERDTLLGIFEKRKGELDETSEYIKLQKSLSGENRLFTQKENDEMILHLAAELDVPEMQIENLMKHVELEKRFQLFNVGNLIKEADELSYVALHKLAKTGEERQLLHLRRDVKTLLKMIELAALKSDTNYFDSRVSTYNISEWYLFLEKLAKKTGVDVEFDKAMVDYPKLFASAGTYYHSAQKRDRILSENMARLMKEKGDKAAVMVTGGYHTEGITDAFRTMRQSYVVIMPRITSALEDIPLKDRLTGELFGVDLSERI